MLEVGAARTAVDVGACRAAGQDRALRHCQPLADLCARALPRAPSTHQRLARLKDERLHLLSAHAEHGSDFSVRVIPEFEEHERRALVSRQPLNVLEHLAQVLPPLDLIRHALEK